jgi:PST family polysaccharide transporter
VVTLTAQVAKFIIGTGATMVLARLLDPNDFGLVALAVTSAGVLAKVKDAGLPTATINSPEIRQEQATALFWLTLALAVAATVVTLMLAPAVGWFFRDVRLVVVMLALASVPLLEGLTLQLNAVMTRQMRFVALGVLDTAALSAAAVVALTLAWRGAGYWALVAQEITYAAATAAATWTVCLWRPGRPSRQSDVRPMVAFGLHLSGYRVLNYLATNLDTVFVGRFRGPLQAGFYDRAFRILSMPSSFLNQPLTTVAVPALSRLQRDPARYRLFYVSWIQLVFGLTMPLVAFLFVDAEPAVLTILGAQWMALIPIYRALAPAAFVGRLTVITQWLYLTTGRTDRQLRWSALVLPVMVVAYAVGINWGARGVAVAHAVVVCGLWYPTVAYCCRTAPVRPRDVMHAMTLPAAAAIAAAAGVWGASAWRPEMPNAPVTLAWDFVVYAVLYVATWLVVPAGRRSLVRFVELGRDAMAIKRPSPAVAGAASEG